MSGSNGPTKSAVRAAVILRALFDRGPHSLRDLERVMPADRPASTLRILEGRLLVRRHGSRGKMWSITPKGVELVKQQIRLMGKRWGQTR